MPPSPLYHLPLHSSPHSRCCSIAGLTTHTSNLESDRVHRSTGCNSAGHSEMHRASSHCRTFFVNSPGLTATLPPQAKFVRGSGAASAPVRITAGFCERPVAPAGAGLEVADGSGTGRTGCGSIMRSVHAASILACAWPTGTRSVVGNERFSAQMTVPTRVVIILLCVSW